MAYLQQGKTPYVKFNTKGKLFRTKIEYNVKLKYNKMMSIGLNVALIHAGTVDTWFTFERLQYNIGKCWKSPGYLHAQSEIDLIPIYKVKFCKIS